MCFDPSALILFNTFGPLCMRLSPMAFFICVQIALVMKISTCVTTAELTSTFGHYHLRLGVSNFMPHGEPQATHMNLKLLFKPFQGQKRHDCPILAGSHTRVEMGP